MSASFAEMERLVAQMGADVVGSANKARLQEVGKWGTKCVERAVETTPAEHGSLADRSMSGWHAKGREPFALTGREIGRAHV